MVRQPDDSTLLPGGGIGARDSAPASARRAVRPEGLGAPGADVYVDVMGHPFETERYTGIEEIGRGGSSVVVRAFDKEILRDVAIKILDPAITRDGSEVDRFAEEARITGQLEHPNIVPIYELSVDPLGRRFLSMKLVEGVTLDETLQRLGEERLDPIHLAELLQVFVKVCDAVSFAHSRGVLHRDLKPKNVMISDFGQVYVLDWGIARLQGRPVDHPVRVGSDEGVPSEPDPPGVLIGTAFYMGPEQLRGQHDDLDERADVFALGATLYQILTLQPPLTVETVRAIRTGKAPPRVTSPDRAISGGRVPPELSRIAMRAIAFERCDRYPSVAELKRDVEAFQRGAWDLPRVRLAAGSTIVREGEPGDAAYVVLEGQCVAFRDEEGEEIELRRMGPGDVFGEMAVFSSKPRSASVRAATDVRLLVVTGEVLSKALGLNSWTGAFVKALADRFREADQRLRAQSRGGSPPSSRRPLLEPSPESWPAASMAARVPDGAVPASERPEPADRDRLRRAADELPHKAVPAGALVVDEGTIGGASFILLSGRCVEYTMDGEREVMLRELAPGDLVCDASLLSAAAAAPVRAATDAELLVVDAGRLWSALGETSWVGIFVRALATRLREADERFRSGRLRAG
jgi:serine/threonine-protein kinase